MAKKSVVVTTCDVCGVEQTQDFKDKRGVIELPPKWVHLSADTATKNILCRDLCEECSKPIVMYIKAQNVK